MAEQELNGPYVRTAFQQMHGERVTQTVRGNRLGDPGAPACVLTRQLHGVSSEGMMGETTRKEPGLRTGDAPVRPQKG